MKNIAKKFLLRKPRFVLVYGLFGVATLFAHTTEPALRLGIALVFLGEALRLWANGYVGHVKVNQAGEPGLRIGRLVTAGPYAFVRNPLYLGSFIIGIGFCIIVSNLWLGLMATTLFFLLYNRQIGEEESDLQLEGGSDYLRYRAAVPRWIPSWRRYSKRGGKWCWKGIAASKEWKTLMWVCVLLIVLYFREEIFQERELLFTKHGIKQVILLGVAAALIAVDGTFELSRHLVRPGGHLVHPPAVPKWWPRLRPAPCAAASRWRWAELQKEYHTVAAILTMVFLIEASLLGSEWLHLQRTPGPLAKGRKADSIQTVPAISESQVVSSRVPSPRTYRMRIEGGSLNDVITERVDVRPAQAFRTQFGDIAGLTSGLSTFTVASIVEEIDDLHDEERFNTLTQVAILSAVVGVMVEDAVELRMNRSLPQSASAFSPQEAPVKHWNLFLDPAEREVGIAVTYRF